MATLSIKASEDRVNLIPKRVELPFERQVKILTNKPLECFYRSSEVIKSLTFAFFSFLMPILNFIFNRFRTHNVELINLKGDLAQNKFDALQNVLENPKLAPLVEFADHDDFEGFKRHLLKSGSSHEVEALAEGMYEPSLLKGICDKLLLSVEQAKESLQEEDSLEPLFESLSEKLSTIRAENPNHFLSKAKKHVERCKQDPAYLSVEGEFSNLFKGIELEIEQLGLAADLVQKKGGIARTKEMKEHLISKEWSEESLDKTLTELSQQAYLIEDLKKYLLNKGTFGSDETKSTFQAGLALLKTYVEPMRDRSFISKCFQVIQELRNSTEEDLLGYHVGRQVHYLAKRALTLTYFLSKS